MDLIQKIKNYFLKKEIVSGDNGFMEESYDYIPSENLETITRKADKLMNSFMAKYSRN